MYIVVYSGYNSNIPRWMQQLLSSDQMEYFEKKYPSIQFARAEGRWTPDIRMAVGPDKSELEVMLSEINPGGRDKLKVIPYSIDLPFTEDAKPMIVFDRDAPD